MSMRDALPVQPGGCILDVRESKGLGPWNHMVALALIRPSHCLQPGAPGMRSALFAWQYARQELSRRAVQHFLPVRGLTAGLVALFVGAFTGAGPTPGPAAQFGLIVAGMVVSVLLCILWLPSVVASVLGPLTGSPDWRK